MSAPSKTHQSEAAQENKPDIAEAYWEHVLEHGAQPVSVFKFCKNLGLSEGVFFREYGSFEALEGDFWAQTVRATVEILDNDEEAAEYDARQKLLAFYYTYFEQALDHRSRYLLRFPSLTKGGRGLGEFEKVFEEFALQLVEKGRADGQVADMKQLNMLQHKALYSQFRFLIDFHLKDDSKGFQDTDALIEKSVRFFFDAAHFPVIESSFDLFRFLLPRLKK